MIQGPEVKNPAYEIWRNILILLSLTKCAHLQIFPKILAEFKDISKPSMDFRGIPVPPAIRPGLSEHPKGRWEEGGKDRSFAPQFSGVLRISGILSLCGICCEYVLPGGPLSFDFPYDD